MLLDFQELLSQVRDIDNMLGDLESHYDVLKADGFVTATDGLKAQVHRSLFVLTIKYIWLLSAYVKHTWKVKKW